MFVKGVHMTTIQLPTHSYNQNKDEMTSQIAKLMGPIWGPPGAHPDGPHVGLTNLAIGVVILEPSISQMD